MTRKLMLLAGAVALVGGSSHAQTPKAPMLKKPPTGLTPAKKRPVTGLLPVNSVRKVPLKGVPNVSFKRSAASRGTDADLKAAPTVEAFIDRLPEWGKIYPKEENTTTTGKSTTTKTIDGGVQYDVTKTPYSITTTPEEIVAFQPVNGFWLGSMIQERGIVEGIGSFTEVPIEATKRPRIKITTDLLIPQNVVTINNPSSSSVQQAISQMIVQAAKGKTPTGSSITYDMTENHTQEQTTLDLGLDARYMNASVKAKLSSDTSVGSNSVTMMFIEKAFTVKVDFEGRSGAAAFFNEKFTMDDARKLVDRGEVSVNNLPAYLASVTYGRMLVVTMTAKTSASNIQAALDASYEAGVGGISASSEYGKILNSTETDIQVTSVGGPSEATQAQIKSGKIADFFSKSAALTTMVPISYTVNTVRENRMASMARTTEYTATTYNANNTFFNYNVTMYWKIVDPDDGVGDNTVECYGELRINGDKKWEIVRDAADRTKKEKGHTIDVKDLSGQTLKLTSDSLNPTVYQFTGFLKDKDGLSKDDTLLSFTNIPIRLEDLVGKGGKEYGSRDFMQMALPKGAPPLPTLLPQGAARLYIRVDKA